MPARAAMPARLTERTPSASASSRAAARISSRRCCFCSGRRARETSRSPPRPPSRRHHLSLPAMNLSHQRFVINTTSVYYQGMASPPRDRPREREPVPCPRSSSRPESRGLGRKIAEAVLAAGHQLVATARQPGSLSDLAERYGDRILPVALDVTDPAAAAAAVAEGVERSDASTSSSTTPATPTSRRSRTSRRGFPQADRHQPVRRRQRHQGRAPGAARTGRRAHHPGLLDRRAPRDPGTVGLPVGQVGGRWLLEVLAAEVAPLGIGDRARAGRDGDRLGRLLHADDPDLRALSADGRAEASLHDGIGRRRPRRPGEGRAGRPRGCRDGRSAAAAILGSEAYAYATAAATPRAESDAAWRHLSVSTDRDDATAAERDPLGARA